MSPLRWIMLSSVLFGISIYGLLTRRNAIGILLSVEVALNSVALSFVVFSRYAANGRLDGQIMAMFIIAGAAAEAVVAIAIFVCFYRRRRSVDVNDACLLKG